MLSSAFFPSWAFGDKAEVHIYENYTPSRLPHCFCHHSAVILCMGPLHVCAKYLEPLCFDIHVLVCVFSPYVSHVEFLAYYGFPSDALDHKPILLTNF
jgi:hypothetical protein